MGLKADCDLICGARVKVLGLLLTMGMGVGKATRRRLVVPHEDCNGFQKSGDVVKEGNGLIASGFATTRREDNQIPGENGNGYHRCKWAKRYVLWVGNGELLPLRLHFGFKTRMLESFYSLDLFQPLDKILRHVAQSKAPQHGA